jgi:hypothetical protein
MREALVLALDRLTGQSDIEERLEIDHDTRGLPGTPDIVASILEKIDACSVFVADITPIAISEGGKHVANPNVLIELGYAKKALSTARVVTIWNTTFTQSRPEDLPFDLRGRRGPITYALEAGASREALAKARALIIDGLVDRIGACLSYLPPQAPSIPKWHAAIDGDRSIWVKPGETIRVNENDGSGTRSFLPGGRWYVRVLPTSFDPKSLDTISHGPVVGFYGGFSSGYVAGGLMTYAGSVRADIPPILDAASIWFRNTGEIWSFQTRIGGEYRGRQYFLGDGVPERWADVLASSLNMLVNSGAKGPYHVRLGVTGIDGFHWEVGQTFGGEPPIALEPSLEAEFIVNGESSLDWREGLVAAWSNLRRVFALGAPKEEIVDEAVRKAER